MWLNDPDVMVNPDAEGPLGIFDKCHVPILQISRSWPLIDLKRSP